MKLIIAGGRDFYDTVKLETTMAELLEILSIEQDIAPSTVEIVSGGAKGADLLGMEWAITHGHPYYIMKADWNTHGRSAGYIRNSEMAHFADAVLAFWDGESRGTRHMIETMEKMGKPVYVVYY